MEGSKSANSCASRICLEGPQRLHWQVIIVVAWRLSVTLMVPLLGAITCMAVNKVEGIAHLQPVVGTWSAASANHQDEACSPISYRHPTKHKVWTNPIVHPTHSWDGSWRIWLILSSLCCLGSETPFVSVDFWVCSDITVKHTHTKCCAAKGVNSALGIYWRASAWENFLSYIHHNYT